MPQRAETQGTSERILGRWLAGRSRWGGHLQLQPEVQPSLLLPSFSLREGLRGQHPLGLQGQLATQQSAWCCRQRRPDFVVATKVAGPGGMDWLRGGPACMDAANIAAAIDGSLQRLGTDYIDLLQLHWPDRHGGRRRAAMRAGVGPLLALLNGWESALQPTPLLWCMFACACTPAKTALYSADTGQLPQVCTNVWRPGLRSSNGLCLRATRGASGGSDSRCGGREPPQAAVRCGSLGRCNAPWAGRCGFSLAGRQKAEPGQSAANLPLKWQRLCI